jgi:epoxyqueuosine reductase
MLDTKELARAVTQKALAVGADLAGVAAWSDIMSGPSLAMLPHLSAYQGVGVVKAEKPDQGAAPGCVLVVGVTHPGSQPELDWWQEHLTHRTHGNDLLVDITTKVAGWLAREHGEQAWDLPYYPSRGGVHLKDAAVLAGLGCVGWNNLFITPKYGPRIRLRAMALARELPSSGPLDFDPCDECPAPCRDACPQGAMSEPWLGDVGGVAHLPARDGSYDRTLCNRQLQADIANHRQIPWPGHAQPSKQVRYCRRCELACVAGRPSRTKAS